MARLEGGDINMDTKRISTYIAPVLLVLSTALTAVNWYLKPGRSVVWIGILLFIAGMSLAFNLASGRANGGGAQVQVRDSIARGIVCGGGILAIALAGKLAVRVGLVGQTGLTWRAIMAILGAFLIFTGNGIPKALTPLAAMQCDAAKVQAFQRFGGWTWVLAGFAIIFGWLVLPIPMAQVVTGLVLPTAMILLGIQWMRLRRSRPVR